MNVERKPRSRAAVKMTVCLPQEAVDVLRELASDRNASFPEVIRRALSVDKYLADATKTGCKILVEDPDKLIKELVLF